MPITSPVAPCGTPVAHPGSLESALRALPFVAAGVQVSAVPLASGGAKIDAMPEHPAEDGGDFSVVPTSVSLARADDLAGLAAADVFNVSVVQQGVAASALAGCVGAPVALAGLTQGTPYFVRVYALNAVGYSAPAPARSAASGAAFQAPMRAPGRPTSVALAVKSGAELRVTWSPPLDSGGDAVSSYLVEFGTALAAGALSGGGNVTVTYLPDAGPYSRVLGGLAMGVRYFVRVSACNSQGCGTSQQSTPTREHPRQCEQPSVPAAAKPRPYAQRPDLLRAPPFPPSPTRLSPQCPSRRRPCGWASRRAAC